MSLFDTVVLLQTENFIFFVQYDHSGSATAVPSRGIQPFSRKMFDFHETCGSNRSLLHVSLQKISRLYLNICLNGNILKSNITDYL